MPSPTASTLNANKLVQKSKNTTTFGGVFAPRSASGAVKMCTKVLALALACHSTLQSGNKEFVEFVEDEGI